MFTFSALVKSKDHGVILSPTSLSLAVRKRFETTVFPLKASKGKNPNQDLKTKHTGRQEMSGKPMEKKEGET